MHLKDDDKDKKLSDRVIAKRAVRLASASEGAFIELEKNNPLELHPVYIVGSEVPIPGGTQEEEDGVQVTKVSDFKKTVKVFKEEFLSKGLDEAWGNVIAVVVQPGVEFSDESVHEYNREATKELIAALDEYPNLVFEGHSTDYQTKYKIKEMVQDGIAILKVGPALTFALREALFALCLIEEELLGDSGVYLSNFMNILENEMLKNPSNWKNHYHTSGDKLRLKRHYSMSDRSRYYLPVKEVDESIKRLIDNLELEKIPLTLLSQYMPIQYTRIRTGKLNNDVKSLIQSKICDCIKDYMFAVLP